MRQSRAGSSNTRNGSCFNFIELPICLDHQARWPEVRRILGVWHRPVKTTKKRTSISSKSKIQTKLFNYPIRSSQHVRWNRQTDLLGRFQINDEFKLRRLLYRQVCGLRAFQDFVDISGGAAVQVGNAHAVKHEATSVREEAVWIHRRQPALGRELCNLCSLRSGDRARQHEDCA